MAKAQPLATTPNKQLAMQAFAQLQAGNPGLALQTCDIVLAQDEHHADALNVAGLAHKHLGNLPQALALMRKSVASRRPDPEHIFYLANSLMEMGRLQDALVWFERLAAARPDAEAWNNVGLVLIQMGRHADAVKPLKQATKLERKQAGPWINYGLALMHSDDLAGADRAIQKAIALEPANEDAQLNLAVLSARQGKPQEALALYYSLIERGGAKLGLVLSNCANLEAGLGRYDVAEPMYRRSVEVRPQPAVTWDNWLFCLMHAQQSDAASITAALRQYAAQFEAPLAAQRQAHGNDRDPGRRLNIGIVSADLRSHVVASFFEPLLEQLHQSAQLKLHAYSNFAQEDAASLRMRRHFANWNMVTAMDDEALAAKIREDGIDILVDLSGHTSGNRLLTFARKPAPVQLSWMGCPGSTGLASMDYYFADPYFLPPGLMDNQFSEKIVQLPASVAFQPDEGAPAINLLPALGNGYVTFGSFSHLRKLNRSVVALWAQLLRQVPDSRLVVGGLPKEETGVDLLAWFREEGIDAARLRVVHICPLNEFLALFHAVDIHLDTFPYNSGTTTWHAIWMGVPSITLMGATSASRAGASILGQVGLEQFAAADQAAYVDIGVRWARQLPELAGLRAGMRKRFAQSAPNQPALVAQWVERAWRTIWQAWAEERPPQSFAVAPTDYEILKMQNNDGTAP